MLKDAISFYIIWTKISILASWPLVSCPPDDLCILIWVSVYRTTERHGTGPYIHVLQNLASGIDIPEKGNQKATRFFWQLICGTIQSKILAQNQLKENCPCICLFGNWAQLFQFHAKPKPFWYEIGIRLTNPTDSIHRSSYPIYHHRITAPTTTKTTHALWHFVKRMFETQCSSSVFLFACFSYQLVSCKIVLAAH